MPGVRGQRSGGQNAKTVKQHKLEGTRKKHRHSGYTNPDPPLGAPPAPKGLKKVAATEWRRMIKDLRLSKTLAVTDGAILYDYVQLHALAERLQVTVDELPSLTFFKVSVDGAGTEHLEPKVHPAVGQLRQARMAKKALLVEFGQTPASRGRVKMPEKPAAADPFAEFDGPKAVA